jgi:hypothetical protein
MNAKWGWMTQIGLLAILLLAGCKSSQPDLKPPKQAEVFNPPSENINPNYPKQAFNDDPSRRMGLDPGGVTPARGSSIGGPGVNPGGSFGGPGR